MHAYVIFWLRNVIDVKLHSAIKYCVTAKELWDDLKERYAQGNAPRVHEFKTKLYDYFQQGEMSV